MNWIQKVFHIKNGTDYTKTAVAISDGIHVKGLNVWLMICSSLLASIGLDTNSTAIIIGAMLISPLMSPILGVGFSVGIHDKELFLRSINNLAYITFFSLLTSVIYFLITPLGEITSEILARTKPTVLDIGVAFFGGVAGIVSASRKEKTNALPGVAIATALMPPLCAAGFGLATGKWEVFGGAFYLFFINAAFIALSTFLIVKLLKFPIKSYIDKAKEKRVSRLTFLVLLLVSFPSFWFLFNIYKENKTRKIILSHIVNDFRIHDNEILKWEIEDLDTIKLIKTFFSGMPVSETDKQFYNHKLQDLGLNNYRVRFFRMNLSKTEMDKMSKEMTDNIMKNIELQNNRLRDSFQLENSTINQLYIFDELKAFYPNIAAVGIDKLEVKSSNSIDTVWMAIMTWDTLSIKINKPEATKNIQQFLKKRLNTDTVWILQTEQQKVMRKNE